MTFKEKLQKEHPEYIDDRYAGGCACCPHTYMYERFGNGLCGGNRWSRGLCEKCWNRTIPGTEKYFIYSQSTERVAAGDIIEVWISHGTVLSGKRVCSAEYPNLVLEDALGDQTVRFVIHADRIEDITLLMKSTERVKNPEPKADGLRAKVTLIDEMHTIPSYSESTWNLMRDLVLGKHKINMPSIQKVIFNDPATIVIWADGEKTVVKCQNGEPYDPEKGLAMAITKRALGNKGNYFDEIKKWTKDYEPKTTVPGISEEQFVEGLKKLAKAAKIGRRG